MTIASISGAITWYSALRKQQADVEAAALSSECPLQQAANALSELWYMVYFIFKPVSLVSGSLALLVPLLRLFDISNTHSGSMKRRLTTKIRASVAFVCASCFALSLVSCWYVSSPPLTQNCLSVLFQWRQQVRSRCLVAAPSPFLDQL
jgi:hypothetical protein